MNLIKAVKPFLILVIGSLPFGAWNSGRPSTEGNTAPEQSATIASEKTTSWAYKNGDWQLRRHAEFNKFAQHGNIDLVFLGDSITQGWEDVRDVWDKYYSGRKAANFGINLDDTRHVLWRIENGNFEGIQPKAIIILIGINNVFAGNTAQDIADGVIAVVKKLRKKVPESKILLLAIFPSGERPENPQRRKAIVANSIFQKIADGRMIRYLDIGDRFTNRDGTISKEIMPDLVHLSPRGYEVWAEAIEPVVKDLMGEK